MSSKSADNRSPLNATIKTHPDEADVTDVAQRVTALLLAERNAGGWWTGQLSTSALSTATACMALHLALREQAGTQLDLQRWRQLLGNGLRWLTDHQNSDGGWGDTVLSISNISTSMLAHAVLVATQEYEFPHAPGSVDAVLPSESFDSEAVPGTANARLMGVPEAIRTSGAYVAEQGGVEAVLRRYGKDRTFSVPILTHCALAGIVDWNRVIPLPFELARIPARFYAAIRLPVVSYALPALIAIGQVIFRHRGCRNPVLAAIRRAAVQPTLRVLESIQPPHGGFLEATPLTSFVCMSLLGCGLGSHPVTRRCLQFIQQSVRTDGSWPIDTNLSTWVTTLSINALSHGDSCQEQPPAAPHVQPGSDMQPAAADVHRDGLPIDRDAITQWLLGQQYTTRHPYTNAAPGGWSWTDLPGGVPDADDTPGAMLALLNLRGPTARLSATEFTVQEWAALEGGAQWLLDLQNRDGGWPTFCRGWGTLPFDRSSCDLTAHAMRALDGWRQAYHRSKHSPTDACRRLQQRVPASLRRGLHFLQKQQRADGTWLPLWFGHQFNQNDENPLYGTSRVLLALAELPFEGRLQRQARHAAERAAAWLVQNQNDDGGWSARKGLASSVEETGLAVECLTCETLRTVPGVAAAVDGGAAWLAGRVKAGSVQQPAPIGFYFAKLWYFEALYPTIFAAAGLLRWQKWTKRKVTTFEKAMG